MTQPTAAMLVIGDEILSGRTRDSNLHHLAQELTRIGIMLQEARVVADKHPDIVAAVRALSRANTPMSSPAAASGRRMTTSRPMRWPPPWARRSATAPMRWRCCRRITTAPACPSTTPASAWRGFPTVRLIDNPVSTAPGFTLGNVHVMAGVPNIFQAMVARFCRADRWPAAAKSQSLRVTGARARLPRPSVRWRPSIPTCRWGPTRSTSNGAHGTNLVIRGQDPARLDEAMLRLTRLFG
jgi:hypothetical protein